MVESVQTVIEGALPIARRKGQLLPKPEHVLFAMLSEDDAWPHGLLEAFGITQERLEEYIARVATPMESNG